MPYRDVWEGMGMREILEHLEALPEIERSRQFQAAAMLLLKTKQLGGKDSELEDFYSGAARRGLANAPYSSAVMRGIELSQSLGLLRQPHLDILDSDALFKYWRRSGFMRPGSAPPGGGQQGKRRGQQRGRRQKSRTTKPKPS